MANTYSCIAAWKGGYQTNAIFFGNIPQTYKDLMLWISTRSAETSSIDMGLRFNNNVTNNWNTDFIYSTNAASPTCAESAGSGYFNQRTGYSAYSTAGAGVYSDTRIYLGNYANASYQKQMVIVSSANDTAPGWLNGIIGARYSENGAVTDITIIPQEGAGKLFDIYTTAQLYGIKNT